MSFIDVDDLIYDPYIAGQVFSIVRRREYINEHGEQLLVAVQVTGVIGQVSPTANNSLVRDAAFSSQQETIKVITAYRLRGAGRAPGSRPALAWDDGIDWDQTGFFWDQSVAPIYQPDLVLWHGDYYIVQSINDYTPYGAGFLECECTSIEWQTSAASVQPAQIGRANFTDPAQSGLVPLLANPPKED